VGAGVKGEQNVREARAGGLEGGKFWERKQAKGVKGGDEEWRGKGLEGWGGAEGKTV